MSIATTTERPLSAELAALESAELRLADVLRALHETTMKPGARLLIGSKAIYPDEIYINADGDLCITELHPVQAARLAMREGRAA